MVNPTPKSTLLAPPPWADGTATPVDAWLAAGAVCPVGGRHGFAADPALPARDRLLDPAAMAAHLPALLGRPDCRLDAITLVRAKYRIGESLRVVYRLDLGAAGPVTVTARVFPGGQSAAVARRAGLAVGSRPVRLADGSELPPVRHDPRHHAVWWTFPNDRRLRGVANLLRPGLDLARLAEAGGTWQTSEVVEYAPERSVTLRASDADGADVAYVKAYAPGSVDVATLADRYETVAAELRQSRAGVAVPTALGWSREPDLLVLEAMPGSRWADVDAAEPDVAAADVLRRLGSAIATMHETATPALTGRPGFGPFARLRMTRVDHSAELVGRARPDVLARTRRLRVALAGGPPPGDETVALHGDCHPKNLLLDRDRVVLLDLDQAGLGSPSADLGSLLARLHHADALGPDGADRSASRLAEAALDGYAAVRPLPTGDSLRWHTVAALVAERAVRAVNRVHAASLDRLDDLLELAERVHAEGRP